MNRQPLLPALALSLTILASPSFAALNVLHSWTMGEAEGGSAGNPAAATLLDTEAGVNLALTGAPLYDTMGGALGVDFGNIGSAHNVGATEYFGSASGDVNPGDTARWGFEAVVRIDLMPGFNQELAVFELGGGSSGIVLSTFGNSAWGLHRSGVNIVAGPNPVLVGQRQHLAGVLNAGSWQLYVDGALTASFPDAGYDPAAGIRIGAGNVGSGDNRGFNGLIETVRVFDYTGTFDINDTLYGIPEPTSAMTALAGLGMLALRRRRR